MALFPINKFSLFADDLRRTESSASLDAIIVNAPTDSVFKRVKIQLWKHVKGAGEVYVDGPNIFFTNANNENVCGADHVDQSTLAINTLLALCRLSVFFIECEGAQNGQGKRNLLDLMPAATDVQVVWTFKDIG